jgi:hypothetical protein
MRPVLYTMVYTITGGTPVSTSPDILPRISQSFQEETKMGSPSRSGFFLAYFMHFTQLPGFVVTAQTIATVTLTQYSRMSSWTGHCSSLVHVTRYFAQTYFTPTFRYASPSAHFFAEPHSSQIYYFALVRTNIFFSLGPALGSLFCRFPTSLSASFGLSTSPLVGPTSFCGRS